MSATINPELRELQQQIEEMRVNPAKTQGEIEIIRQNSERNDRQTIKQFVIFTVTMLITLATTLIGTSVFQTDALRREMSAKFEVVDQRFASVDQRMNSLEKRMDRIEISINEIKAGLGIRRR